jgi:hypothetical protein
LAHLAILCLLLGLPLTSGCSRAPQLGGDEDCLLAAEALWTAITSKRTPLVDASAGEIDKLHAAGKLHDDAYESLSGVVASARAEDWASARKSLKFLLSGQRRVSQN